uniref:SLC13 family permease n=1 Tax=Mitsuokella multacida TaxID=52226 RepID=UPI0026EDCEB3|nr:SLC13 family permease [Mitsuokella multacida]
MNKKQRNALITLLVGAIIWFAPVPEGVTVVAWHLAAVFIATVVGFILQPLPIGAVAFIAITFSTLSGLLKVGDALSGYGNSTIWLIVCAFLYSRGFIKSGLGKRIAFGIIKAIGKITARISALYAAFIAVSVAVGAPPLMTAIIFGIFADVPISLTHYGNGCAPIYYGAGYVSQSEWWKNGFVMTTITTVIYLTIGAAWWKVIGLW